MPLCRHLQDSLTASHSRATDTWQIQLSDWAPGPDSKTTVVNKLQSVLGEQTRRQAPPEASGPRRRRTGTAPRLLGPASQLPAPEAERPFRGAATFRREKGYLSGCPQLQGVQ